MTTRFRLKAVFLVLLFTTFVAVSFLVEMRWPGSVAERWNKLMSGYDDRLAIGARGNASAAVDVQGVLERAATADKTVIITALNQAWAAEDSMIDLFLSSFQRGENTSHLVNHLVIITLDEFSHNRCISIHQHCYHLKTEGVDFAGEAFFMTDRFLTMMWRRIEFLGGVLDLGYNFVFTDADVMWLRNPFPRFFPDADLQISCDRYTGRVTDEHNTGFVYVRANNRTQAFYKYWHASRLNHPHQNDQNVFNDIERDNNTGKIGIKIKSLHTLYFAGFCEVSGDFERVCTMHSNCCTSIERKVADLRLVLEDWKRFTDRTPLERSRQAGHWQAPRDCILSWV